MEMTDQKERNRHRSGHVGWMSSIKGEVQGGPLEGGITALSPEPAACTGAGASQRPLPAHVWPGTALGRCLRVKIREQSQERQRSAPSQAASTRHGGLHVRRDLKGNPQSLSRCVGASRPAGTHGMGGDDRAVLPDVRKLLGHVQPSGTPFKYR